MNEKTSLSEFLVLSRGQWDENLSREEIQSAIARAGKLVSKHQVTDGPFAEAKEPVGLSLPSPVSRAAAAERWGSATPWRRQRSSTTLARMKGAELRT